MNREQKAAVIDEIAADISESQAIFAIDYRGITVAQADQLRARLRDADAVFRVVKNSLTERAAAKAGAEELLPLLEGPTALTFVRGDAAAAAKAVADFTRATQLMAFKGGLMDGAALSSADVSAISRLPARDVLYGQLVGLIANPLSGLARTLNALIAGLAVGLGGVLSQKEADPAYAGSASSEATEAAAASGEAAASEEPPGDGAGETAAEDGAGDEPAASGEPAAAAEGGAGDEPPAPGGDEAHSEAPAEAVPQVAADAAVEGAEEAAGGGDATLEGSPSEGETEAEAIPQVAEEVRGEEAQADAAAPAAAEAVPQDEPAKDAGDALVEDAGDAAPAAADDAPKEDETAPTASDETQTDDSAPEAPSGDDDKEDQ